ncbi:hypothetical protein, partial [Streptococcus pneumoniae]|uniref:hypothetical protein n=1 Tax=Streptococcus pneumoniae TaxID=1313 RepID=UPI001E4AAE3E
AKCIDWNFNMRYRVICDKNHIATGEFNTRHRDICRWNNEQKKVTSNLDIRDMPEVMHAWSRACG